MNKYHHTYKTQSGGHKGRRWFQSPLICSSVDQIHAGDQNPMLDQLVPNFTKVNDGSLSMCDKINSCGYTVMIGRSLMTVSFETGFLVAQAIPESTIIKDDHEFLLSLHPPPECWDYGPVS